MKKLLLLTVFIISIFLHSVYAQTDPSVSLMVSKTRIGENGSTTITAALDIPTSEDVIVDFDLSGTALNDIDFIVDFVGKGTATTVVGTNGKGSAANQLNKPNRIYIDLEGNIYISDQENYRIQKWAPGATEGITVAGGNGNGSAANQLSYVWSVFVDVLGNIFISDTGNNRIQKWLPGSTEGVTVAGGNGQGTAANQLTPFDVYLDEDGNIYIADQENHRIQKWAPGATEGITVAGGNGNGSAANQLNQPYGVLVDVLGNIFISDTSNSRIQKWLPGSTQGITVAGGNGQGSSANQLSGPFGTFVDLEGNIFISDTFNNRIQKWAPGATEGITVAGGNGQGSAENQFFHPTSVFDDLKGSIYIADYGNNRIQKQKYVPQIVIPAGQTIGTLTLNGIEDELYNEGNETIIISPSAAYNAILDSADAINVILVDSFNIEYIVEDTFCNGASGTGSINLSVSGRAIENVSFSWIGPNEFTSDQEDISNLVEGNYYVSVFDTDGIEKLTEIWVGKKQIYNELSICYITSDTEQYTNNRIYINNAGNYNVETYQVLKEGSVSGQYELIGEMSASEDSYLDTSSNNISNSASYKVRTKDKCNDISTESGFHKTILLQSSIATDNTVNLTWTPYEGLIYNTYIIYKKVNDGVFEELVSLSSSNHNYNDITAQVDQNNYTYYVSIFLESCNTEIVGKTNSPQNKSSGTNGTNEIRSNYKLISEVPLDDDGDSVMNNLDTCPETPAGEEVDADGCSESQLDDDGDTVMNDKDLYSNTPIGANIDANGGVIITPNDIIISWKSPTCPNVNNAEISIQINQSYPFDVTLIGPYGYNNTSNNKVLTNSLELTGLTSGEYQISFSFSEGLGADFSGYNLNISSPEVAGKSIKKDRSSKTATFNVSGDKNYSIYVNDVYLREVTFLDESDHEIVVDKLLLGENHIKILPKNQCRGVIEEVITIQGNIQFYPNPTEDLITLNGLTSEEVTIQVYTTDSSLIFSENYLVNNGSVAFSLEHYPTGVYIVKVFGNENDTVESKVIKK